MTREIRYNLPVRICAEVVPLLMCVSTLIKAFENFINNQSSYLEGLMLASAFCFIWYIVHFSFLPYTRTILSDRDISQILIIKIGSWRIVNMNKVMKWDDVDCFERSLLAGYLSGYRIIGMDSNSHESMVVLNSCMLTFNEEDRQFIINHLPFDKIDQSAKKKIIKSKLFQM